MSITEMKFKYDLSIYSSIRLFLFYIHQYLKKIFFFPVSSLVYYVLFCSNIDIITYNYNINKFVNMKKNILKHTISNYLFHKFITFFF